MAILLAVLSILILLLAVALAWTLRQLHGRLAAVQARLDRVPALPSMQGRPVISIEILNTVELALRETALAGPAAKLAPRMLERIVYSRAAGQIAEQLKAQGVQAQVTAHVA